MPLADHPHLERAKRLLDQARELLAGEKEQAGTVDGREDLILAELFTRKAMERLLRAVKAEDVDA